MYKRQEETVEHPPVIIQQTVSEEVYSRISSIESELKQIREEMRSTIDDLKNTIFELRASISEIGNPFNYLRKYGEVLGLKSELENLERSLEERVNEKPCAATPTVAAVPYDMSRHNSEDLRLDSCKGSEPSRDNDNKLQQITEQDKLSNDQNLLNLALSAISSGLGLGKTIKVMKWAGEMLSAIGKDNLLRLIDFYESANLISSANRALIYNVVNVLTADSSSRLTVKDHIMALYKLAKTLGLSDSEADAEILKMMTEATSDDGGACKKKRRR